MDPTRIEAGATPVAHLPPRLETRSGGGVGVAIVNYNTTACTLRCLESLRRLTQAPDWILVLDNGPRDPSLREAIDAFAPYERSDLRLFHSEVNLGFAAGCNLLIGHLLAEPGCASVILLNNDAVAMPDLVERLADALDADPAAGMAGGRVHRLDDPDRIDTLGISIYASLMPADRYDLADPYLGPSGGCAIIARACLDDLRRSAGYWFDPRFFCYCEDTDLVLRANRLGYRPRYVDAVVALHEGQASSGRGYNRFIAYHGIRNSVWMIAKSVPAPLLLKYGALLLLAHLMTIARHLLSGSPRLLIDAYGDAFRRLPEMIGERGRLRLGARIGARVLDSRIAPRFYRRGYLGLVGRQLLARYRLERQGL
ncbi:glycosyltransferase family 2 protein [Imhoffiella purpurea]|uniref:Glycosyl transferase, family 2 n=1 Tax=Imhoffiella purpurea TaxID=1249627 RepID=W9W032_9GAMM|nr:glycosyltransferase family 2 protein [Imhoffiella purpurea]EXJ15985.1 Glycosyl transferase, family 2 [Imhoffiella purpurea]